jgi:hypothetical protein
MNDLLPLNCNSGLLFAVANQEIDTTAIAKINPPETQGLD